MLSGLSGLIQWVHLFTCTHGDHMVSGDWLNMGLFEMIGPQTDPVFVCIFLNIKTLPNDYGNVKEILVYLVVAPLNYSLC